MTTPDHATPQHQIQLWTYNNTQYRDGSANNYYHEWFGTDALKAAAHWLRQDVTPDLGLLHVTKQGKCQWLACDKRLCDQGVQHGDTVILLSTSTLAQTPQLEPEQKMTPGASFVIHPGSQPASSAASPASRPTLPINPLALAAILSPPPFSRPPPSCPAPFFPSRCRNGGCGGGAAALGPGRNGAVGRPRAPHTASVPSRGSVGAGGALVLLLGGGGAL